MPVLANLGSKPIPQLDGNAQTNQVLSGKTFYNNDFKGKRTGTMTNRGAVNRNLGFGETYAIEEGYHNGNGRITAPPNPKLKKVGSVSFSYGYNKNTTATLNISKSYSRYKDLTVDDIVFPVTASSGWFENYPDSGGSASLSNFRKSYNPSNGVITINADGSYNYVNTSFSCDIYVLDRYGL